MSINLNIKLIIIFLSVIFYFLIQGYKLKNSWNKNKLILWLTTRILIIVLLFLSVSEFKIIFKNNDNCTIFLVDESLSVEKYKKDIENYVNSEINKKNKSDEIAVIGFGKDVVIELPLTCDKKNIELCSTINKNFTNLEKALDFSIDYFPKNKNRRLVIITDKNENIGEVKKSSEKIKKENINLFLKTIDNIKENDVELTEIIAPKNIYKSGNIPISVYLNSTYETHGELNLYINNKKIINKKVDVKKGENKYTYKFPINEEKEITIKGEINFIQDENKFNNIFTIYRSIKKQAKVLVISENEEENINKLLDSYGIKRVNYASKEVPTDINFLSDFNEIILINTDYNSLPNKFDNNLEKAVEKFGVGLLTIGGERSFALGGYENTTLERILPVSCKMKNNRKQANTGLMLLIDCSGSMNEDSGGVKKIELAKQAATEAINALEKEDYVGVLAFSDTLEWIVPFQKVNNKEKLKNRVGKLKSKGGTLIIPALIDGINAFKGDKVKVKHMILLTDGQAEKKGFNKYINEMKKNKITASTVAVGNDCDKDVLAYISDSSGGRKYISKDYLNVPKILAKESYISQKKYINNQVFIPEQCNDIFNKSNKLLPELKGYIGTGIKEKGSLVLQSDKKDPILAFWNYGIGKVGVWTSDISGKWSENWIGWNGFYDYYSKIVNYLLADKEKKDVTMDLKKTQGNVEVLVESRNKDPFNEVEVLVATPNNEEKKVALKSIEQGKYKGVFELNELGKYNFLAILKKEGKVSDRAMDSIYLNYSPEYSIKRDKDKNGDLDRLVMELSGKKLKDNENVFKEKVICKNISSINFDFISIPLVLILFFIDIYLRIR
ncbi:VWA domain-containing protein [Clostridium rectalis]|uniref:VWA domain-containing protein n=1 Tax=Clostridium rectalis TaxID=2040295 RepID=UPI000F62ECA0|nr:VWA domain-containing protein [Clostridium rectalis]